MSCAGLLIVLCVCALCVYVSCGGVGGGGAEGHVQEIEQTPKRQRTSDAGIEEAKVTHTPRPRYQLEREREGGDALMTLQGDGLMLCEMI